jgi:hypothetical protein
MPTTPRSQIALSSDQNFQKRLASLLVSEALVVAAEPDSVEHHASRRALAQQILNNAALMAAMLGPTITNGTNLVAAETTYNFEAGAVETVATDAEIRSQIATLWNIMAGV